MKYQEVTGGVFDNATGLLKISTAQFHNLQSLFFQVHGTNFELTANAQIFPVRSLACSHEISLVSRIDVGYRGL